MHIKLSSSPFPLIVVDQFIHSSILHFGWSINNLSSRPLILTYHTTTNEMLAKTIFVMAFATLTMAAPQASGDRSAQMTRVEELRGKGLTCNEGVQGSIICSDGLGGDW